MNNVIKMLLVVSFTVILSGCSLTSRLFESNINPETGDEYKNADLPSFSCDGDHETVKKLLRLGLDYQIDRALECGIESNDLETVKALVDGGADLNWQSEDGMNLLLYAARLNRYNLIGYLLEQGVDPYHEDNEGNNILDYVWGHKKLRKYLDRDDSKEDVANLLKMLTAIKEHGVNIEDMKIKTAEDKSESPLRYAMRSLNPVLTELFLSYGLEIDLSNEEDVEVVEYIQGALRDPYDDLGRSLGGEVYLTACIIYAKTDVPIYSPSDGFHKDQKELYLPYCEGDLSRYYEDYQISDKDTVLKQLRERLATDEVINRLEEEKKQALEEAQRIAIEREVARKAAEEEQRKVSEDGGRTDNPLYPMTAEEALSILQNGYPDYTLLGGGEVSYEGYHDEKRINEPAYLYTFRSNETGDVYVGWVFADGAYKLKWAGEYIEQ